MDLIVILIIVLVLFLLAFLLMRAALYQRPTLEPTPPAEAVVDREEIAAHLGRVIQYQTVSREEDEGADPIERGSYSGVQAFLGLRKALQELYPRVHRELTVEVIGDFSLLYTWPGTDPELKPVVLLAHQDVVPVEAGTETAWVQPPFSGTVDEHMVWGRGAIDMKAGLVGQLEAVEWLLRNGFSPKRTVYLAFGHDEEVGGYGGAFRLAATLRKRVISPECVLDEGGVVVEGLVPGVKRPVALVGMAEKGYLRLELTVDQPGGHSSMPADQTVIGRLCAAIARLEAAQMPARLDFVRPMFRALASELPFGLRLVLANTWLFGPLLVRRLAKEPRTNALLRSTLAPTLIQSGIKDNVLPSLAKATLNCRIMPGDTIQSVSEYVRRVVRDEQVQVSTLSAAREPVAVPAVSPAAASDASGEEATEPQLPVIVGWQPSQLSPLDSDPALCLELTIRQIFPEAVVAPYLMSGASDARHYQDLTPHILRFQPLLLTGVDLAKIHGVNENLSLENCERMVRFYIQWIRNWND